MADWISAVEEQEKHLQASLSQLDIDKEKINTSATPVQIPPFTVPASTQPVPAVTGKGDGPENPDVQTTAEEEKEDVAESSLLRKLINSKLVTTKADLEVLQKDPNSPLYSVKSFEALKLKPELLKGLYSMGFNSPSKIQETALPALLADPAQNMIAQSQSGTGKTAAFVLTMLSRVDPRQDHPQALCLSPTYELALQTGKVTEEMGKFIPGLQIGYAVRGESVPRGKLAPYHIIIGTPGTALDWSLKYRNIDLKRLQVFVLDEADVMIAQQGHKDQSIRMQKNVLTSCQMLLFSATYNMEVMNFAQVIVPNAVVIRLRREEESLENIKQLYITVRCKEDKLEALNNIYGTLSIGQSMIFCRTRRIASWLAEKMVSEGHSVALLSGELSVEQRAAVISRFREGKEKVLITTNVSARGIDIEQVTVVVNFDLPVDMNGKADCETYLHRIGRTGRFGKKGLAINMVDGRASETVLQAIQDHFGKKIYRLDAEDIDDLEKIAN